VSCEESQNQQTERQACRYKYVCLKTHGDDCCSHAPLEYQLKACAPILSRSTSLSVLVLLLYFPSCAHNLARARAISRTAICLCVYKCMYAIPWRHRARQTLVLGYDIVHHCKETVPFLGLFCKPSIRRIEGSQCRPLYIRESL